MIRVITIPLDTFFDVSFSIRVHLANILNANLAGRLKVVGQVGSFICRCVSAAEVLGLNQPWFSASMWAVHVRLVGFLHAADSGASLADGTVGLVFYF